MGREPCTINEENKLMAFIYLFISIYYGRKNSLFFLLFPLALLQGPGAFIDTRTTILPPTIFLLGSNIFKDIIIFYLISVVFYLKKRIQIKLVFKTPMKLYFLFIIIVTLITLVTFGTAYDGVAVIRLFLYMVLGYYLLLLLISSVSYIEFIKFFNVLFWINVVQSIFYILNSSRIIPLFDSTMIYQDLTFGSGTFLRDFMTIPLFGNLLFVYAFVSLLLDENKINKKAIIATLITFPLVLLFSFTRSMIGITIIEIVLVVFILMKYKPRKILRPSFMALLLGGTLMFFIIGNIFSQELGYLTERVQGAVKDGKNEKNVDIRIQYHEKAWELLESQNALIIGNGFNKNLESKMDDVGAWSVDSTVPYLMIFTGVIGVFFFYFVQLYFIVLSCRKKFYQLTPLAITLFTVLLTSFASSFIMGGNPWGSPLFYLNYVLIVYISYQYKIEVVKARAELKIESIYNG